jgi:hypothetical protein
MTAMGASGAKGPVGEVMVRSEHVEEISAYNQPAPGLTLSARHDPDPLRPFDTSFAHGKVDDMSKGKFRVNYGDEVARPTISNECLIHGPRDLTKAQSMYHPGTVCRCP